MSSLYDLSRTEFFQPILCHCYVHKKCNYLIMICNFKLCRRNAVTVNKFVSRPDYGMKQNLWFGLPECFVQLV